MDKFTLTNSILKKLNEKFLFKIRTERLANLLCSHLINSKNILDIGAGDGLLSSILSKKLRQASITAIDTVILSNSFFNISKFNGRKINFNNNQFDCAIICDVLHHTNNYEDIKKITAEALRVVKNYVIIKDHFYNSNIDYYILKLADWIGNRPYGIKLSYNFLRLEDWDNLIKELGVEIEYKLIFKYNFSPTKHILLKIKK